VRRARYLHFEGYKYEAMDISIAGGRIINRARDDGRECR
jgi:hypothetical protein